MPKVINEIKHNLGQREAIQRLKNSCEWANGFSDLFETWSDNSMAFSVSIQGVKISGKVEVNSDSLISVIRIPVIAVPFKAWIPNILQNALKPRKPVPGAIENLPVAPLVLYLHIPKAGGTTLGEFVYNNSRNDNSNDEGLIRNGVFFMSDGFFRENESGFSLQIQHILQRKDLQAIIGHFSFGIHQFVAKPFQYITILRNPVDRVISLYYYLKLDEKMDLEHFANSSLYRELDNDQTRRISGVNPAFGMCSQNDLEVAKENLRHHFAVVGVTERMDETLVLLKQKLNWTKEVAANRKNVNNAKKAATVSETAIRAIEHQNQFDIELHRYANELMNEMIVAQGEAFLRSLVQQKELNSYQSPMS